jgi:hypothetical protein
MMMSAQRDQIVGMIETTARLGQDMIDVGGGRMAQVEMRAITHRTGGHCAHTTEHNRLTHVGITL